MWPFDWIFQTHNWGFLLSSCVIETIAHILQLCQQPRDYTSGSCVSERGSTLSCVSFIIHPRHSLYICCLAPCLCTTSWNIHTKSHRVKLTPPFCFASPLKCLPLKIERRLIELHDNWKLWKWSLLLSVFVRCLSHGEPALTIPFCFSCVLFDPTSWSLTFGPAWNGPSESGFDCRWCSCYEIQEHRQHTRVCRRTVSWPVFCSSPQGGSQNA